MYVHLMESKKTLFLFVTEYYAIIAYLYVVTYIASHLHTNIRKYLYVLKEII